VIIPLYNAEEQVGLLLESLAPQEYSGGWEVVVADNGSTDRGLDVVESYRAHLPRLQVVDASSRRGVAHARNVGGGAADGSLLLFIDDDDVAGEGYLAAMGNALRSHELVCARWDVDKLNPEWTRELRPSGQHEGPMMWNYEFLPYAAGGTLGVRRSVFEAIGGFDNSFPYANCTDFCWRAQLETGAQPRFVPEAVLHYRYRQTLPAMFSQARNWGREEVRVYSRYRSRGAPRIPLRRSLQRWKFVMHIRRLRRPAGRAWWATELGNHIGRLQGSLAERTLML
jgi:GT2 family glycosyltransferase